MGTTHNWNLKKLYGTTLVWRRKRKYRQNLHGLSKEEFDVFDRNVETMNTSVFEGFWNSDEHNWICSTSGRLSEWRK